MISIPGIKSSKIYELIDYVPEKSFKNCDLEIAETKHEGDNCPDKTILALILKLIGNCACSATLVKRWAWRRFLSRLP